MKVLLISHAYIAPENRVKLWELAKFRDLKVGVVLPKVWRTWHGEMLEVGSGGWEVGCKFFSCPVFFAGDGGKYFYEPLKLFRTIKKFNPDIIHIEEEPWTPVMLEIVSLNKLFFNKKLIFFTWENLDLSLGWWRDLIEKLTFKSANLAIAGNSEAKQRIKNRGFSKKVEVLPQLGVDLDKFKIDNLKKKFGVTGFVVGFVGRLVEEKGIATLFKAVAKLQTRFSLVMVSTTPKLPERFQKLALDLGISDRLKVVSGVSHEELPQYMNMMDVLVLPSETTPTWKEQFGRVLIEAMACKVPVIGSSSGAITETIGDSGLIFREGNADDLADKILKLASDASFKEKLAVSGYQRVVENFTHQKIAEKTYRIYQELFGD